MLRIIFALALFLPFTTHASTFFPSEKTILDQPSIETQFLMDESIEIIKPVNGDVFCLGNTVKIKAPIYGDVICAAKDLEISGNVLGNVRSLSLSAVINAVIERRATIISSSLDIQKNAQVKNEWYVWTRNLTSALLPDQQQKLHISPMIGRQSTLNHEQRLSEMATRYAISLASAFAFALIMSALFPKRIQNAYRFMDKRKRYSILWGAWLAIGMPVLALFAILTVVGMPIGFAILAIWFATVYSAQVLAGGLLGYQISTHVIHPKESSTRFLAPAIGIPLLWALFYLPVIGWLVRLIAISIGLSGMYYSAQEKVKDQLNAIKETPRH